MESDFYYPTLQPCSTYFNHLRFHYHIPKTQRPIKAFNSVSTVASHILSWPLIFLHHFGSCVGAITLALWIRPVCGQQRACPNHQSLLISTSNLESLHHVWVVAFGNPKNALKHQWLNTFTCQLFAGARVCTYTKAFCFA